MERKDCCCICGTPENDPVDTFVAGICINCYTLIAYE